MNFWLWFEIVVIFINRTPNLQGIKTLSKIHIYSKMINKKIFFVYDKYNHLL
jgi:hypothetical protein